MIIKNIISAILILMFSMHGLFAQVKTEAYFGHSGKWDQANDIIELYDKGYYVTGGFEGDPYHFGWNIKTDINLEIIFDKVMVHDLSTIAQRASVSDMNGNIYVTGFTTYPEQWPFVTKIDSCGNKVWCRILDFSYDWFNYGWAKDIIVTKNNEIVLLTYLDSDEEIETIFLIGLSIEGEVLWKEGYASKNNYPWINEASGYSLEEINNEYFISGKCYWPYPNDTTHLYLRPLFIGIDSLFEEKWILPFYALDSVFGKARATIALNDSIFMGVGKRLGNNSEVFSLLMFYDKNGNELGYNQIYNYQISPDNKRNHIRDITRINDSLFMAGVYYGPENSGNPVGEFVIDTAANLYNFESRPNTVASPSLIKTYDNNYVIATSIEETKGDKDIYVYKIDENLQDVPFDPTPHNYDSLCPGGIQSGTIDLTSCLIWTNIGDAPSPKEYYSFIKTIPIKAYPNPVIEGKITFEFENTEHHRNMELRCFDIYGEEVYKEKIYRYQGKSIVNVSGWQKGMYFGVVYSGGKVVGRCKFVKQ